jgi:hypothetical protein
MQHKLVFYQQVEIYPLAWITRSKTLTNLEIKNYLVASELESRCPSAPIGNYLDICT